MPTVSNPVKISALYAAFFNRAPDAEGLAYWEAKFNEGQDLSDISAGFVQHEVFVSTYGSLDDQQFVEAIYTNMLGNAGDAGGIAYWVGQLDGGLSRADMVAQFVENALDMDALDAALAAGNLTEAEYDVAVDRTAYLTNRAEVGKNFAETLGDATLVTSSGIAVQQDPAYLASIAVLQGVDHTQASVDAANQMIIDASFAEDPAAFINNASQVAAGTTFNLTEAAAAGADAMRLTGDMDARIDLTANDNQVRGLDLDGNGTIAADGVENNDPTTLDDGKDFQIVDAYSRNKLNEGDLTSNFLGDIAYDGTGFEGDGVNTDGNIFLGGLGADTALGGIGNDFMVGGGVATGNAGGDTMYGGRNADFFFGELSLLDNTDGNNLTIHGGSTSDDAAVGNNTPQDSDWLLLEVSDDEDGTVVDLSDAFANIVAGDPTGEQDQAVITGAGRTITMTEIENVDASGNLYGFLNDVDVNLGGNTGQRTASGENVGIGSTAQLAISGSAANNILIGGFDNDRINGDDGNDLLFGGRLDYDNNPNETQNIVNPNIQNITNDGMDELFGGDGDDHLVFEADGGIYEGDGTLNIDGDGNDTLWLTELAFGTQTAGDLTTDGTVRMDLGTGHNGGLDNYAGYGGADAAPTNTSANYTADQTNYADGVARTAVQDVENVIATGLGAVDYKAAGTNNPELSFNNEQNIGGIDANLDLRGTAGANTLYANTGDDVIEGRTGNDMLSGGEGNDDFIFTTQSDEGVGDGLDIIHRQADANNDNLWDRDADGNGLYGQDFGVNSTSQFGPSSLSVDFSAANLADDNVWMDSFSVVIGGETFEVSDMAALEAVTNVADLADLANAAFQAQDSSVSVSADGDTLTITDATPTGGRDISDTQAEGYAVSTSVTAPGTSTLGLPDYTAAGETVSQDRLLFVSYTDRADNERTDDDAVFGGDSLGADQYAQDLVVGFDKGGSTVIAEDQAFRIDFENLTVEDEVTVSVNGVQFTLTVGRDLDGSLIAGETTEAFVERLSDYIDDFLDDDTAAGKVNSTFAQGSNDTNEANLTLTQNAYSGEETVFMSVDVNVEHNGSLGEGGTATITNESENEITLFQFDGRDNALNAENVLFLGDSGNSRAVLETAADTGGDLFGSDAIVVNVAADDEITGSAEDGIEDKEIAFNIEENLTTGEDANFAIHGDDQLFGGNGNDNIEAGTGDDRVYGSFGLDTVDGGKDIYLVDGQIRVLNDYERDQVDADPNVLDIRLLGDTDNDGLLNDEGLSTQQYSAFDDTLIFQQADFGTVGAGGSEFEITLDLSADQENGGAGKVVVDGDEATNRTLFTNMENIRTVSGNGTLAGQGNDTLDLSVSVDPLTGSEVINDFNMRYDLTSDGTAGNVDLDRDNSDSFDNGETISKVDGVENVLFGGGDDVLLIDETEAGKNNLVDGGDGDDTVNYSFSVGTPADDAFNPAVTLTVNGEADTDYVDMTGGLVGTDMPRDTLESVENINFTDTLHNPSLDDTLDVTNVQDAVVDFVNGEVRDGNNSVQVEIGNMVDFEVVNADYNDTVIVADADAVGGMGDNSKANAGAEDVVFNSFLNYDKLDQRGTDPVRMTTADLRSVAPGTANTADTADIPEAENIGLFTFNLGENTDRVDYSNESDTIAVSPNLMTSSTDFNVLVDSDSNDWLGNDDDRVDVVTGAEEVVASQGDSIIDLTANVDENGDYVNKDVIITYQAQADAQLVSAYDANSETTVADARYEFSVRLEDANTSSPFQTMNFIEYRDADAGDGLAVPGAYWNRVEGSDGNETVQFTASQEATAHGLNLRGGDNTVLYNLQTNGVEVRVDSLANGITDLSIEAKDAGGNLTGTVDDVKSHNGLNEVSTGSLTVYGSTLFRDSINLASLTDNNVYLLGEVEDGLAKMNVTFGTTGGDVELSLIGFENLTDGAGDDVYEMADLANFFDTFESVTDTAGDSDTLKVFDGALDDLTASQGIDWSDDSIELDDLEDAIDGANDGAENFDFDTLDISALTQQTDVVSTNDAAETLIVGKLGLIGDQGDANVDVQGFEVIKFTTTDGMGTDVVIDMDNGEFRDNGGNVLFTFDSATVFDFSAITVDMDVTVEGSTGATVITDPNDEITGDAGDDILVGGAGADILDGGVTPQVNNVYTVELSGSYTEDGLNNTDTIVFMGQTLDLVSEGLVTDGGGETVNADAIGAYFDDLDDSLFTDGTNTPISVSYDNSGVGGQFTVTFDADASADFTAAGFTINGDAGDLAFALSETTAFSAQDDSADTYFFKDGDLSLTQADSDTINNWDDTDTLHFFDDVAGTAANYSEAGVAVADFAAAQSAANTALDTTVVYNFQFDANNGYLFHDTDADGTADEVITLDGIDNTDIAFGNILGGDTVAVNNTGGVNNEQFTGFGVAGAALGVTSEFTGFSGGNSTDDANYDTITNFVTGVDTLDLGNAGTSSNTQFVDGSGFGSVALAIADANTNDASGDGVVNYVYYNVNNSGNGVVVSDDHSDDGNPNTAVELLGVGSLGDFSFADIV